MKLFSSAPPFIWSANEEGLAFRFSDLRRYHKAKEGSANKEDQLAFIRMQMLAECGQAEVREVDGGVFIVTADAVRLDSEARDGFDLPSPWPGGMRFQTDSVPQLPGFFARIGLVNPGRGVIWDWQLRGPILEAERASYLPTAAQFAALIAYREWQRGTPHDEFANLSLLATLREAFAEGCLIDLEAYRETVVARAEELSIDAREEEETGDLILRPFLEGGFAELSPDEIEKRLAQLRVGDDRAVMRVGKTIVLLDPSQTKQARAIATRGRVPKRQRKEFENNPSEWLAEHVFPDMETEFSPRVTGIGAWTGGYLGTNWEESQDWFGMQPTSEKTDIKSTSEREEEDEGCDTNGVAMDEPSRQLVPLIIPNDEELGFGWRFPELPSENTESFELDFTRYARAPLDHQKEAVRWLLGHARRALDRQDVKENGRGLGAGGLLADDMGLGKTFSTLICIAEWFDLWRKATGSEPPAVVIVAPLSLMENWKEEIKKSFQEDHRVFTRVLMVQAEADIDKVRRSPGSRDEAVPGEVTQYGLGFGDGTERSLDYPGSCVLTTYQTLRDYRFSFAKAEWSAAIFDEAQNIKNPNAMQTIAAKALKALFRVTLTGTPVENHLGDFWSILDTAEPGPLGSFAEFKRDWIHRMAREKDRMTEIGQQLRDHVGGLMLRRTKEEELDGLPQKTGGTEPILIDMTQEQTALYNSVISGALNDASSENTAENKRQNRQLAALWQLRQVSLHPDLLGGGDMKLAGNPELSRSVLERSGKLSWLLKCLEQIGQSGEKALIFCIQKKLQEALAFHLGQIYSFSVPVINGDTKATSRTRPESTRLGLIERFSNQPGFGVCVLSPIAAGAGLNIVAANHVIHLERHWNPAKEDQATDRVYRIGQTKPVIVYLPTGIHPNIPSFDLVLHRLLEKKRRLQSALGLVPPEPVSAPELMNELFGQQEDSKGVTENIGLDEALQLPWRLFEALIATIYQNEAQRVMLTQGSADHGCDVVVLDIGPGHENLLIQCKSTSRENLNSEVAVREIEGARPFYEEALGVKFNRRCLHTTAKKFSPRTLRAAEICGVALYGRSWLKDILTKTSVKRSSVLATDTKRERI